MRGLVALLLVGTTACGQIVAEADAGLVDTGGDRADAPAETCVGATTGTYTCGESVRACDPTAPTGLPRGACAAGATCDVTVRAAACDCPADDGPRFPWRCTCVSGNWSCEAAPPDGRICGCQYPPPFTASCEAPPPPAPTDCRVEVTPVSGATAPFPATVTLRCPGPLPDAAARGAIVSSIQLHDASIRAWVMPDVTTGAGDATTVRWEVRPRPPRVAKGAWVLRVGPLPKGVAFADTPSLRCEGQLETHFTAP